MVAPTAMPRGAIQVEVGDDGAGFELAAVPTERLGVRVSILERMSSAGGHAEITSAPGSGTRVVLSWPDERPAGSPSYARFATASDGGEQA